MVDLHSAIDYACVSRQISSRKWLPITPIDKMRLMGW